MTILDALADRALFAPRLPSGGVGAVDGVPRRRLRLADERGPARSLPPAHGADADSGH